MLKLNEGAKIEILDELPNSNLLLLEKLENEESRIIKPDNVQEGSFSQFIVKKVGPECKVAKPGYLVIGISPKCIGTTTVLGRTFHIVPENQIAVFLQIKR